MAPIDPKIQALAPDGVTFTKQLTRTVNNKKASIFIGKDSEGNKVRYTEIDGKMEKLEEKTTSGKNTYVTKKENDAVIMQILGTKSVPAGVTVKYVTDENGTTSPILLFQGEKLDDKGIRTLANTLEQQQRVQDRLNKELAKTEQPKEMPGHVKVAVDITQKLVADGVIKTNEAVYIREQMENNAKVAKDLAAAPTGRKVKPEGVTTQTKKPLKKSPNGLNSKKAAATPESQKAIEAAKKRGAEKTGKANDPQVPAGIKKPEDKPRTIAGTETSWGKPIAAPKVTGKDVDKVQKSRQANENGLKMGEARAKARDGFIDRRQMQDFIRNINEVSNGNVMNFLKSYYKGFGVGRFDIIRQLAHYNTPASKNAAIKLLESACKENKNNPAIQSVLQSIENGPLNWTEYATTADSILLNVMKNK